MPGHRIPGPTCATTAPPSDLGTNILVRSPAPGPLGKEDHPHAGRHKSHSHSAHPGKNPRHVGNRKKVAEQKRKAKQHLKKVCDSLKAVPLVDVEKKGFSTGLPMPEQNSPATGQPLSTDEANRLMSEIMAVPTGLLEKMPDPHLHSLDLDALADLMKEEFLPMTETVLHFLSYIREKEAEPILEDLEEELLKREASFERFESAVTGWIAQMQRPPIFLGGKPYLGTRALEQEAIDLLEDSIKYLKTFGKFLHGLSVFTAVIEIGKNAIHLVQAARDHESQETHEVAFYAMGTAISAICLFCVLAVGLELAVIGATMGIVGGVMNFLLEPLAKQKYVPPSQVLANKSRHISKEDYDSAVRILRLSQGRSQ
jgi:hypothetical protein